MEIERKPNNIWKTFNRYQFVGITVGDYRIIYDIVEKEKRVKILFIGHRKNIYRKP